ncbi:MAG TPA: holo-[acyl-carrier-protein] synthase [Planctomycetaceae bacterium]|nr:holo-[acyl-carrier-protein] synthase [Planctomycetaceae bacterium]
MTEPQGSAPLPSLAVIGIGTDIIECERIDQMIEKHGQTFLTRVYTTDEIAYCKQRKAANQHYAGRWAAKEAVLKALGTGWAHGIQWTDVEVVNQVGGKPEIVLSGVAEKISRDMGIAQMMISISHCKGYATAYATAVGEAPSPKGSAE